MNRIIRIELKLADCGMWEVDVTKEFAPEYGGGTSVFRELVTGGPHHALEMARRMVTLSPANNPEASRERA